MIQKIIFLRGLPASGKSTWSKNYIIDNPNFKRINKDDTRIKLGNKPWSREFEELVLKTEREEGLAYLKAGNSIIVDDTNFHEKHLLYWQEIADANGYSFEIKEFDESLKTCLERNKNRENAVPEEAIYSMYNKYVKDKVHYESRKTMKQDINLKPCFIFDIDGTLALMNGRNPYDYTKVNTDLPNINVIQTLQRLSKTTDIIIFSGREDSCEELTKEWLKTYDIPYTELHMRKSKDYRADEIIKGEMLKSFISNKYYVIGIFDDRPKVCDFYQNQGLTCFRVYKYDRDF